MKDKYFINKGTYLLVDPGLIVNKYHKKGNLFLEKLWHKFYKNPKKLKALKISRIKFLIWKTPEEDGVYQGVMTQTQTLILLDITYLERDIFKSNYNHSVTKTIEVLEACYIYIDRDDLMMSSLDLNHRKKLI